MAKSELYNRVKERAQTAIMEASRTARDIAPVPNIGNRKRRAACAVKLRTFLETYFPQTFRLAWSEDHLSAIERLQTAIEKGGQFALAMPRGSGKTSLVERAALWAVLTGRRRFVVIVGANESLAEQSLTRIKSELERNELLLADWPRAVYPIRRLESQARRCVGQLYEGQRTAIVWQRKRLAMPTMPGPDNEASGAVLHAAGLTGALRGLTHVDADGRTIRPDLLLVDDPQDRESARSVIQTSERLALLNGDLLGLAGPNSKIAALATVTVICRGDLADQLLNREQSPAWQGEKFKLIYNFPTDEKLWDEYAKIRLESLRAGGDGSEATEFYRQHQAAMDQGAVVGWPARFNPDEVSAVQHAMNLRLERGEAFDSEYQNDPPEQMGPLDTLKPAEIAARCGGIARGICPPETEKLTAFIDPGDVLFWMVVGWAEDFSGHIVDYGCWPEQRARVFSARNASPKLQAKYPKGGISAAVYAGLADLVSNLTSREWKRSDGAIMSLSRCAIDSGWEPESVRLFIRQSPLRSMLTASRGFGVGPGQTAIAEYKKRPGEKIGDGWILGLSGPDGLRVLRFDTNHWKTRVAGMLTRPMGMRGGLTLYGDRAIDHELLSLHLSAETPTPTEAKGNKVNVWTRRPDRDNHWLDALVGAAVVASLEGISPLSGVAGPVVKRSKMKLSERQKTARTWSVGKSQQKLTRGSHGT